MMDDIRPGRAARAMPPKPKAAKTPSIEGLEEPAPLADELVEPGEQPPKNPVDWAPDPKKDGKKGQKRSLKQFPAHLSRRQWLQVLAGGLIIFGLSAAAWTFTHRVPADDHWRPNVPAYKKPPPKPTTEASKLTGVQIDPKLNELPPTAVMIENSPDARPQSGLLDAGVVYEAIAEGGITRFLTLFQEGQPDRLGPVRSVRPYYLDFLAPYDAALAHAGGSGQALAQLRAEGFKDLEAFQNGNYYHRDPNRYAPHNLYTSRAELLQLQQAKGFGATPYTSFVRKTENPSKTPNAHGIDLAISGFYYNPHYDYDAASNSYKRSMAGKPHVDEKTGKQLSPKVVVVLVIPHHYEGIYSVYQTTGSGKAYFFQDGTVTEGVWEKAGRKSQFRFGDANGSPFALNPGQTWISIVGSADMVKITP
jgi:hypothetical protein